MWTNRMTRYFEQNREPAQPAMTPGAFAALPVMNGAPVFTAAPSAAQSQLYQMARAAAVEAARSADIDPDWFSP